MTTFIGDLPAVQLNADRVAVLKPLGANMTEKT